MGTDGWHDGHHQGPGLQVPLGPQLWLAACVVLTTFLLLPEKTLSFSEDVWKLQQKLRKQVLQVLQLSAQGPIIRPLLSGGSWCVRACSFGRLASPCLPPHSLRAKAGGPAEVMIVWTGHAQSNPFHEETYLYAWRVVSEDGEGKGSWQEEVVEENLCRSQGRIPGVGERWGTLVFDLPEDCKVRIRVCAVNRYGRSDWSQEEVEVSTAASVKASSSRARAPATPMARARIVAADGVQTCLQCSRAISAKQSGELRYAVVVCRPIFDPGCRHGPFCSKCHRRLCQQVLPCCICRGLIDSWRETLVAEKKAVS
eukprot:TRINITY_DN94362_c0_g1_i1.p1 TRINITY_DN94362_c0_g1~~TRINITY_DN94362_c0_g1_i1.p1  ORF type:complete len:312 (+),score=62.69 TRINITY_DN94362_c0_g1_i1:44-979(+)